MRVLLSFTSERRDHTTRQPRLLAWPAMLSVSCPSANSPRRSARQPGTLVPVTPASSAPSSRSVSSLTGCWAEEEARPAVSQPERSLTARSQSVAPPFAKHKECAALWHSLRRMAELITRSASGSVAEAVERLLAALERRSITVFAVIPHSAGARKVGLELRDQTVVIFGNPQVGTPLMQSDATVGIELPLRILVWDKDGTTTLGYHDPSDLAGEYSLGEAGAVLERMSQLLGGLVGEAAG